MTLPMIALVGEPRDERDVGREPMEPRLFIKHRATIVPLIRGMTEATETLCRRLKALFPTLAVFEFDTCRGAIVFPLGSDLGVVVHWEGRVSCGPDCAELIERALR